MKTYVFTFEMVEDPELVKRNAPLHTQYWDNQSFEFFKAGPFSDNKSGMVIFTAINTEEAGKIVQSDPFQLNGCLRIFQLREWLTK